MLRPTCLAGWAQLEEIQQASDTGNIRKMHEFIKKAIGPSPNKTTPIKLSTGDLITDKDAQLRRWVEHYAELYSSQPPVSQTAIESTEQLSVLDELDAPPTQEELSRALDQLRPGNAPGNDGIPPDLLKCCKSTLPEPIHTFLTQCWEVFLRT
jgi:hypothetical protein